MFKRLWLPAVGAALMLALSAVSQAQSALGTGNALDRNLGVGTGGVNQPAATPNFRDRNLIITGDVIGGRGFRGAVGYTAESDFRDRLGSNDLFSFRAQSAISSPQLFQNTLTYEQLRFGQNLGLVEYRRAGSGDIAALNAQNPIAVAMNEPAARLQLDRRLMDSTSYLTQEYMNQPRIAGTTYNREGDLLFYNASPLRGISLDRAGTTPGVVGLTTFDAVRVREDVKAGQPKPLLGEQFRTRFDFQRDQRPEEGPAPGSASSTQIVTERNTQHQRILDRMADRYAAERQLDPRVSSEAAETLSTEYERLREQLTGRQPQTGRLPTETGRDRREEQLLERAPGLPPVPTMPPAATPGEQPEAKPDQPPPPPIDLSAILRHSQRIDQFSGATRDRFNELVAMAERNLREGDYLTAEQRFNRALRFMPGHPMATAGAAHAQIGAGLYLSAALTLQNLLSTQPEMIDVRYAPELLPQQPRLEVAALRLREYIQRQTPDTANYAFVLAYIGHQTQDRSLVETGLNALESADPQNRLLPVLRKVWLAPPAETSPPANAVPEK